MARGKNLTAEEARAELAALTRQNNATEEALTSGTSELLERTASNALLADEPSGVTHVQDNDFLHEDDPSNPVKWLAAHSLTPAEGFEYRWCTNDPRRTGRRDMLGWVPTAGGRIVNGDRVLCEMPTARVQRIKAHVAERKRLLEGSPAQVFDAQVKAQGGIPFDRTAPIPQEGQR